MSEFVDAINDLSFLERRFKGLIDAIPALQKIDSLEGHAKELEEAIKGHQASILSLQAQRDAAEGALKELTEAQDKRKEDFATWVAEETHKAQEAAKVIIDEASVKAADILNMARSEADAIAKETKLQEEALALITSQIEEGEKQYAAIVSKLKKIKESI